MRELTQAQIAAKGSRKAQRRSTKSVSETGAETGSNIVPSIPKFWFGSGTWASVTLNKASGYAKPLWLSKAMSMLCGMSSDEIEKQAKKSKDAIPEMECLSLYAATISDCIAKK